MSYKRAAISRRDLNEEPLIRIAEQMGATWITAPPLDGWLYFKSKWTPVEIKQPQREGHKDEFTAAQILFRARARLNGYPYWVWRTSEDVYQSLGARQTA